MKTISTCWQAYITHLLATVSSHANQRYWGRLQWFADKPAWLSPQEVEAYVAMRQAAGAQAGTINRELALLRACLRYAERQHLIDRAPIIKGLPPPKPRMRSLSRAEAAAMVKAADKRGVWYERVYIRLALGTAQRPEAVIGLPWDHVDWEHCNIDFQPDSNLAWRMKRRSIVPFNDMTEFALKLALKFRTCMHVMHYEDHRMDNPRRLVKRLARHAGIEDVSPHVLRHTSASLLLQDGADLLYVSRLLGHADTKITERVYFQHSPEWLKKVTDKLVF